MAKIAFIGLGTMGFPMAGHLATKGFDVTVYNRHRQRAEQWVNENNGKLAATPFEAAHNKDFVIACVGNDDDVREVTCGENGAFAAMPEGSIFIDHTTTSADLARDLYERAKASNLNFIDAPVSGGEAGAQDAKLTIMCGGDEQHFEAALPVLNTYAVLVRLLGAAGSGQLCKMVNQICLAGVIQGLSEGLEFGVKAGLDMKTVVEIIARGAAGSWQMENRGMSMLEDRFDFGFAVDLMRKDLKICLAQANKSGANLPSTALINQFYNHLHNKGFGKNDTSSLIKLLK